MYRFWVKICRVIFDNFLYISGCHFGNFSRFFGASLYALKLRPRARDHERTRMLTPSKHNPKMFFCCRKRHCCISRSSPTFNTLCDPCSNYVARPKAQMHLNFASIEISHIFLLYEANENCRNGLICNGKYIYLSEPIFNFHDSGVNFITSPRLKTFNICISSMLSNTPLLADFSLFSMKWYNSYLIRS